jgi:hypothetical protein
MFHFCSYQANEVWSMQLATIRAEIEHMRRQIARQRKEMLDLHRAGISTKPAEELLARMQPRL